MKILLTGPQGSGKTTQAKIISQRLNLCLVKMGDLIREFAKGDSEEAREVESNLKDGDFVSDEIAGRLMEQATCTEECELGFVVDGYPRRLSQLKHFDPKYDKVFYLDISDKESLQRLVKRGREDDTGELIKIRVEHFHRETKPLIDYYKGLGILVKIDGSQPIEQITEDMLNNLKI